MHCFINGQFVSIQEARLGIRDLALLRGYGIFDFFRVKDNIPLFVDDHIDRFFRSSEITRLPLPYTKRALKDLVLELIELNNAHRSGIRLLLTGGYSEDAYTPASPNLVITQEPIKPLDASVYQNGVALITHEFQRELPTVKTTGYLTGIWLADKIKAAKAMDVLYYTQGHITELTRSNIFIVQQGNTIKTPAANILPGVTRKNILALPGEKFKVEESVVTLDDLRKAKEVFITSTLKKVVPVIKIDETIYSGGKPGTVTLALLEQFEAFENTWLTDHGVNP